jgi:hypothetical protein
VPPQDYWIALFAGIGFQLFGGDVVLEEFSYKSGTSSTDTSAHFVVNEFSRHEYRVQLALS